MSWGARRAHSKSSRQSSSSSADSSSSGDTSSSTSSSSSGRKARGGGQRGSGRKTDPGDPGRRSKMRLGGPRGKGVVGQAYFSSNPFSHTMDQEGKGQHANSQWGAWMGLHGQVQPFQTQTRGDRKGPGDTMITSGGAIYKASNDVAFSTPPTGNSMPVPYTGVRVGLQNTNNTCYMNSFIQSLFVTTSFFCRIYRFVLQKRNPFKIDQRDHEFGVQLVEILKKQMAKMALTKHPNTDLVELLHSLESFPQIYTSGEQQDVTETIRFFFDKLGSFEQPLIREVFAGELCEMVQCQSCATVRRKPETFSDLVLAVPTDDEVKSMNLTPTIQQLVNDRLKFEQLDADCLIYCDKCMSKQQAGKWCEIVSPPAHLCLVLNRFTFSMKTFEMAKKKTPVRCDGRLQFGPFTYELYFAIIHTGKDATSGHYYSIGRRSEVMEGSNHWVTIDDSQVKPADLSILTGLCDARKKDDNPYVLFYRCQQAPPTPPLAVSKELASFVRHEDMMRDGGPNGYGGMGGFGDFDIQPQVRPDGPMRRGGDVSLERQVHSSSPFLASSIPQGRSIVIQINNAFANASELKKLVNQCFRQVAHSQTALTLSLLLDFVQILAERIYVPRDVFDNVRDDYIRFDFSGNNMLEEHECYRLIKYHLKQHRFLLGHRISQVDVPFKSPEDEGYRFTKQLGKGNQGHLMLAVHTSGVQRCIKVLNKANTSMVCLDDLKDEVHILHSLHNTRIAKVFDIFQDARNFYLVNEPYFGGDFTELRQTAQRHGIQMTETWWRRIFQQCFEGLVYLHKHALMHCDIKEANIMLKTDDVHRPDVVIVDFGLAQEFVSPKHQISGTPGYIPPETWRLQKWYPKGDTFSMGVCMAQLMLGLRQKIFQEGANSIQQVAVFTLSREPPLHLLEHTSLRRLVGRALEKDMLKRANALQMLEDPWFNAHPPPATFHHSRRDAM